MNTETYKKQMVRVWPMVFNAIFNNITVISSMVVSFLYGGNQSTFRKPM